MHFGAVGVDAVDGEVAQLAACRVEAVEVVAGVGRRYLVGRPVEAERRRAPGPSGRPASGMKPALASVSSRLERPIVLFACCAQ